MQDKLFRKAMVLTIIVLFVGTSVTPNIGGTISKISGLEDDKRILNEGIPSSETSSSLSFHTFDKTGEKQHSVVLPTDVANDIYDMQEELKYKIVYEPRSNETKALKIEFVDMLDAYGLIPNGLSKNYVLSLLNPSWLNNRQKTTSMVRPRVPFLSNLVSRIIRNIINLRQIFKNRFEKNTPKIFDKNPLTHPLFADTATATVCSIGSGGQGVTLPLILTPRPRVAASWYSPFAVTLVSELISGEGFLAEGGQTGTALGFIGMGITYVFYDFIAYGFVGYALYTKVTAEHIDRFEPPNQEPVISDENPPSGTQDVPLSLSELSFRIRDADGDLMDYTVTTEPNIGTGTGYNKKDGVYIVPISGLEYDKFYSWTVEVTDDKDTTRKQFNFFTEGRPPFDPFDEGWQYRKKVTIDHTQVAGDLSDFPVLISTLDTDLRDKAQNDGDDILFMDGPGIATKLYHEIECYNGASGELISWVNIPSLSSSVDTVFYMYYGNPSSSSQQIPEKVWDSNYIMVQHMHGSNWQEIDDSTSNNNDVTSESPTGPSYQYSSSDIIGYAVDFNGINNYLRFSGPVHSTFPATWEVCTKPDDNDATQRILDNGGGDSAFRGIDFQIRDDGTFVLACRDVDSGTNLNYALGDNFGTNDKTWTYLAMKWAGIGSTGYFYQDGNKYSILPSDSNSGYIEDLVIGTRTHYYNEFYFDGRVDEIRVSDIVRSDDWISTSYNTMNDPSSFLSFGSEE